MRLRSKVTTAGDARSKVGHLCPCSGFIMDWFFQRKNKSSPEGCSPKRIFRGSSDDPDQGSSGVSLRANPKRRPV